MGPLIFKRAFTLLGRRVQVAVGMSLQAAGPVEGEVVLEDLPQLRTYRLWHDWQRVRRRARREAARDWSHNDCYWTSCCLRGPSIQDA